MNRRKFLTSAGGSVAALTLGGVAMSSKAHAQSGSGPSNSQIYANCNSAHAIAAGQGLYAATNGGIWGACSNPMLMAYNDWETNHYDQQVMSAVSQITPSMVTSTNLNQAQIL